LYGDFYHDAEKNDSFTIAVQALWILKGPVVISLTAIRWVGSLIAAEFKFDPAAFELP